MSVSKKSEPDPGPDRLFGHDAQSGSRRDPRPSMRGRSSMQDVVIVTGASSGIGAATARLLGAAGASVVVNYRSSGDLAEGVAGDVIAAGGRAVAIAADIGNEADFVRLFEETDRAFGPVTGLVNNAGVNGPALRALEDYTFREVMEILAVNTAGVLIACREAVRRMSTKHGGQGGSIVNVSSIGALT